MDNPNYNSNNDSRIKYVMKGKQNHKNDSQQSSLKNTQMTAEELTPEMIIAEKRKYAKKRMIAKNVKNISIILSIVIVISVSVVLVGISCINDILAIHIPDEDKVSVSVVIEDDMDTNDVIDVLHNSGAIKNALFCKIAAKFIGYTDEGYIARTYEFNRSMGLEKMLDEIKAKSSSKAQTVTLTFPEGYTADQIIDMLAENNVCSREKLLAAIAENDFSTDFEFLNDIANKSKRYNWLEGYLFPDTYEFYIGESAVSVIKKFLNNFNNKWTDDYSAKAEKLGYSVDQIVRIASIVEKEAVGSDMPMVGSILINRLKAGMQLGCDSTKIYMKQNSSDLTEDTLTAYSNLYDTYICSSLPVGAICNPGTDAIKAVLDSPNTDYYYFLHDSQNKLRLAKTLSEHENNASKYGLAS